MSSTSPDPLRPCLLAVGALERDNFGDLLYGLLLQQVLADSYDITLAAPIEPAPSTAGGSGVISWSTALAEGRFDGIWTVGGEIGGTTPEYAYLTTFGLEALRDLVHADHDDWTTTLSGAMAGQVLDPPYIPRASAFPRSAALPLVINSVGLSGIPSAPDWRYPHLRAALREADFISVRDRASSAFLTELGIEHRLAPDIAHIIATVRPRPRNPHGPVLVHLSAHAFKDQDPSAWAQALDAAVPEDAEIRLFVAGLAPGHDSVDQIDEVRAALLARAPRRTISMSEARAVWDRTDEIADARLWIGNSLHGRIVAAAYGVPRVSLAKPKVDSYAADWDEAQPFAVDITGLTDAVGDALASMPARADQLSDQAMQSFRAGLLALNSARELSPAVILGRRLAAAAEECASAYSLGRRQAMRIALLERAAEKAEAARAHEASRIVELQSALAAHRAELAAIRSSRRWRMFERFDRMRARTRRKRR